MAPQPRVAFLGHAWHYDDCVGRKLVVSLFLKPRVATSGTWFSTLSSFNLYATRGRHLTLSHARYLQPRVVRRQKPRVVIPATRGGAAVTNDTTTNETASEISEPRVVLRPHVAERGQNCIPANHQPRMVHNLRVEPTRGPRVGKCITPRGAHHSCWGHIRTCVVRSATRG